MAQSDQTVQNATFPAVRADINDNLAALYSQSSGASAPTVTVAFQPWVDTSVTPPLWKIRNAANTGWITVGALDADFATGGITPIANGGTGQTTASAAINALLPSQTGNAGKFLSTNGTAVSWLTTLSSVTIQVFTTSGTYTPASAKTSYLVFAIGGGGGGGTGGTQTIINQPTRYGVGGGGGSGGCAFRIYNNTELGSTATVTVGAAGTAAGAGGSTSFDPDGTGLTITGVGGSAGGSSSTGAGSGGAGGGVTNSLITMTGNTGGVGNTNENNIFGETPYQTATGGTGAAPIFWGAGRGGVGGLSSGSGTGGAGEAGIVVVLEF